MFREDLESDAVDELPVKSLAENADARDALFASAYGELRVLARSRLRNGGRSEMLDTTVLVHEAYLRFSNISSLHATDRRAFFAYASRIMRSVIVDTVREYQSQRRSGAADCVTLDTGVLGQLVDGEDEILRVHDALYMLSRAEPRLAVVVEMRYFGGYSEASIAEALEVTERTVRRDWQKARVLLVAIINGGLSIPVRSMPGDIGQAWLRSGNGRAPHETQ